MTTSEIKHEAKAPRNVKDLTGQRFGRFVVLSFEGRSAVGIAPKIQFHATWVCKCDCGVIKIMRGADLKTGNTQSCGCLRKETARAGAQRQTGCLLLPIGESIKRKIITGYKSNARHKNQTYKLSDEQVTSLLLGHCHYCGISPNTKRFGGRDRKRGRKTNEFLYNGIDRTDNAKGYVEGNVVSCCKQCNYSKRGQTYQEFNEYLKRIARHLSR